MADGTRGPPLPPLHRLAERAVETDTNLIDFFHGDWSKLKAGGSAGPVFEETPDDKEHMVYGTHGPWERDENFTLFPRSTPDKAIEPTDFHIKDAAVVSAKFEMYNPEFYKAVVDACDNWFKTEKPVFGLARLGDFTLESSDAFYLDMGPILLHVRVDKMVSKLHARLGLAVSYVVTADVPNYATWEQRPDYIHWGRYMQGFAVNNSQWNKDYRDQKLTNIGICDEDDSGEFQLGTWRNPKLDRTGTAKSMALSYLERDGEREEESFLMRVAPPKMAAKVAFARITVRVVKDRAADTGYVDKPFSMKFGVPHDWEGGAQGWTPEKFSWLRERLAEFPVFDLHQLREQLADIERKNVDAAAAASFAAAGKRARTDADGTGGAGGAGDAVMSEL